MDETDQDSIFPLGKSGLVPPQGGSTISLQHTHNYRIAISYPVIARCCASCGVTDILDLKKAYEGWLRIRG